MDTAKVDIRKLQLLNDRINQTIEALNQVRFSVHGVTSAQGLSHTGPQGFGQQGFVQPQNPYAAMGQGFGPGISAASLQNPALGLGHTGFPQGQLASPFGAYGQGSFPQPIYGNPLLAQNPAVLGQFPQGGIPFGQPGVAGLSHTGGFGVESGRGFWGDPYLAAQIAQTFPNAQSPVPPVMTVY